MNAFLKIIITLFIVAMSIIFLHAMYCDRLILSQSDYIKIIVASITPTIGVLGIAMGAFFALGKYHTEQRTTRIKELYFDETFLSLTKSIEHTMGGCNGYQ